MSTERYTTSKFVRGEFRTAADNKIDLEEEPYQLVDNQKNPLVFGYKGSPDKTIVKMIRPAFCLAILARGLYF